MEYYSQHRQDYIIDSLLRGKTGGFFIDIGAYDGITFSNTYFFEKTRNWNGICIEPIPEIFEKLKKNRKCHLINAAISTSNEKLNFKRCYGYTEMLSGLTKFRYAEHEKRTEDEIRAFGGESEIIKVQGYLLQGILDNLNIKNIDYLSIDIEGGEFEVLDTIDFNKYKIKLFSVENPYYPKKIRDLMEIKGYRFLFNYGADDFYVINRNIS